MQASVIELLTTLGWIVTVTDAGHQLKRARRLPKGWPDLVAYRKERYLLIECKSPTGELRPDQVELHARLARHGVPVHVVRDVAELSRILRDL